MGVRIVEDLIRVAIFVVVEIIIWKVRRQVPSSNRQVGAGGIHGAIVVSEDDRPDGVDVAFQLDFVESGFAVPQMNGAIGRCGRQKQSRGDRIVFGRFANFDGLLFAQRVDGRNWIRKGQEEHITGVNRQTRDLLRVDLADGLARIVHDEFVGSSQSLEGSRFLSLISLGNDE